MCGRYLIEEEAYSDILEILYRSGTLSPISHNADGLPYTMREAMAETMHSPVPETVPGDIKDLFPGEPRVVTGGEVFPTNIVPVLIAAGISAATLPGAEGAALIRWGFPHWKNSNVIINARCETVLEKPMFRESLLNRRCVIPSNGFYEWGVGDSYDNIQIGMFGSGENGLGRSGTKRSKKIKYLFRIPDEKKLFMAGFWNTFRDSSGEYAAFTILTTAANNSVSSVHNRMPLILSRDECDDWLGNPEFTEYALRRPGPMLSAVTAA